MLTLTHSALSRTQIEPPSHVALPTSYLPPVPAKFQISLSLNSIHHHILISLSIFSLLFHSIPQAPPQRCRIATLEHKHLPQPPPHPPSHPPMLISTMTSKSSTEPTVAVLPKSFSSSVSPPFILIFLIYSILNFAEFVENDLNG